MRNADVNMKRVFPYGVASPKPAIRIKPGLKMALNRNVLRSLGNPSHIQFWWEPSKKALLVGSAPPDALSSYKISDYCYTVKGNINIRSTTFINAIMSATKWHKNKTYAILGDYIPELDMVAFRADDAVEMEVDVNA